MNVAGYYSLGIHDGVLTDNYPVDGEIKFFGNSGWYLIQTVESFNGIAYSYQGNFIEWFSSNAFGGTNYSNTPVGAISHTDEPHNAGNFQYYYFGYWAAGRCFAYCAWNSFNPSYDLENQEIGDPFVER